MLLDGNRLLITGVLTKGSIAYSVAERAQEEGAEIVLTGFGRTRRMTERAAARLPETPPILELDVNSPDDLAAVAEDLSSRWGRLDGVLHAIAFAPGDALGGNFMTAPPESAEVAFRTSAYSFKALAETLAPLMGNEGGSFVGMDFDASVAWPVYDWMGVAKAALESTSRYLARDLGPQGVRVNLVAAGPGQTPAPKSIPGFQRFEDVWDERSPLGWDVKADAEAVARSCVALLSDWFPKTTGEIVHVDGGFHAIAT